MPSNSSLAAKKRSVNAVRKKTRKRLLKKEKQFGNSDDNTSITHEKRRKLYSHQKIIVSSSSSSSANNNNNNNKTPKKISVLFNTMEKNIRHETKLFMDPNVRDAYLLEKVNEVRKKYTTNQRDRSTILIIVKNRKHAVKLAPKLGWNGKNSEVLRKIKTKGKIKGSLGRYIDWKGIGIIDPKTDDDEDMLVVINQLKAGQLHTILICANPKKRKVHANNSSNSSSNNYNNMLRDDDEDVILRTLKLNNIKKKFSSVISLMTPITFDHYKDRCYFVQNDLYTLLMRTKYNVEKVSVEINQYVEQIEKGNMKNKLL